MKPYKTLLAALTAICATAALTGCDDDFDRPPVIVPHATMTPNTTIADLKARLWQTDNNYTTITAAEGQDSVIIKGRVISSDAAGNLYQEIVIADETAAIDFSVDIKNLYQKYQYGQEVVVNVTDMTIGAYRGLVKIGGIYNGGIGRMDEAKFTSNAQPDGLANTAKVDTAVVTLAELANYKESTQGLQLWQYRLIRLENMHFAQPGAKFGNPTTSGGTSVVLSDADGKTIDLRTNNYSDIASATVPDGTGSVTAILSYFGSNWQLVLVDLDGLKGFTPAEELPSGEGNGSADTPYDVAAIRAGSTGTGVWVTGFIVGYIPDKYYDGIVFGTEGTVINTNIVLAPAADVTDINKCIPVALVGTLRDDLGLGNHPENLGKQVTIMGNTAAYFGQTGLKETSAYAWGDKGGETPVTPPPAGDVIYQGLLETDADISTWTLDNGTLAEGLTYIWAWKEYPEGSGKHYLNASAYVSGEAKTALAYAISPEIDLAGHTTATMTFDHAAKFQTTLTTLCGIAVRLAGDTEWTQLTVPTWPSAGSWAFVSSGDIDLSAYAGKKIQVAFKYGSSSAGADTWEIKNLKITD